MKTIPGSWRVAFAVLVFFCAPSLLAEAPADLSGLKGKLVTAQSPQVYRAEVVATAVPVKTPRLDSLPIRKAWQPGDPIRFIPKRVYPLPGLGDPVNPTTWQVDPLLKFQADAGTQSATRGGSFATPTVNILGQLFSGAFPPDTVGDVGPTAYVQGINAAGGTGIEAFTKTGASLFGPITLSTTLGAGLCATGAGDPIILYDEAADRWMLTEFSGAGNALCVYISQTSDPGGTYFAYQFNTANFPDYPKYGVWPDAYYVSTNEGGPSPVYAMDRTAMLGGAMGTIQRFTAPSLAGFGFQALTPADIDGPPPPAGAPGYFIRHRDDESHNPGANNPAQDFLEIWELDVDFATPANSTFTGPTNIAITEFDSNLCGLSSFMCFPQPNGQQLDPLREVVMWRAQYRNFGSHQTLVGNLTTDVDGTDHGGVRWFELRNTGGGWSLFQEGTLAPDADNRWMGSAAMNADGHIAIGYSVVSTTQSTDIRYTGRLATDAAGTLPQGEHLIGAGSGSQNVERWGDYSAMSVDPDDNCTFWYTTELVTSNNRWDTRIAAFAFPDCGGPAPVCGNGVIEAPEACDDGDTNNGDGCSSLCQVEPGFTCTSQPSVCTPDPVDDCLDENFETGLMGWTVFNTGALNLNWGTTDDGFCWSNNLNGPPATNVTGGAGEAACIDTDAAGAGTVVAYLCSPEFNTGTGATSDLTALFNYQFFDVITPDDFISFLVGFVPPSPATIGGYSNTLTLNENVGGFAALPGAQYTLDLTGIPDTDIYFCVGYGGDFDWYAEVDEVKVTASGGCGVAPSDVDADGIPDATDNCVLVANPAQDDSNSDGLGNVCDTDISGPGGPGADDCITNALDLGVFKAAFFTTPASPNWNPDADFGGVTGEPDDVVNAIDLGVLKSFFFMPPGPSGLPNACP